VTAIVTLPIPVFLRFLGNEYFARIGTEFSILPEVEDDMDDDPPTPQESAPIPDAPLPSRPTVIPLAD
jgi:hypothetical protein